MCSYASKMINSCASLQPKLLHSKLISQVRLYINKCVISCLLPDKWMTSLEGIKINSVIFWWFMISHAQDNITLLEPITRTPQFSKYFWCREGKSLFCENLSLIISQLSERIKNNTWQVSYLVCAYLPQFSTLSYCTQLCILKCMHSCFHPFTAQHESGTLVSGRRNGKAAAIRKQ